MYYRIHYQQLFNNIIMKAVQQYQHWKSASLKASVLFVEFLCFWDSTVQWMALYQTISLCRGTTDKNRSRDEELGGTELNQSTTIATVVTFLSHSTKSKIRQQQSEIFIWLVTVHNHSTATIIHRVNQILMIFPKNQVTKLVLCTLKQWGHQWVQASGWWCFFVAIFAAVSERNQDQC